MHHHIRAKLSQSKIGHQKTDSIRANMDRIREPADDEHDHGPKTPPAKIKPTPIAELSPSLQQALKGLIANKVAANCGPITRLTTGVSDAYLNELVRLGHALKLTDGMSMGSSSRASTYQLKPVSVAMVRDFIKLLEKP